MRFGRFRAGDEQFSRLDVEVLATLLDQRCCDQRQHRPLFANAAVSFRKHKHLRHL